MQNLRVSNSLETSIRQFDRFEGTSQLCVSRPNNSVPDDDLPATSYPMTTVDVLLEHLDFS